ncbi:hypothetical protein JAAARDRAFT_52239 [Jaapia argillacea MUCL 33604]|uniref:RING-type domain-containing protein n=1 Tax=Jaapia argillacea MUCL 33604 TaxID=933084 RepID=A0A067QDL9_9AGAM|nr:hypothetical protein JAAARDRAFT_52239 [Jaapia argillacea MUCL 33604]
MSDFAHFSDIPLSPKDRIRLAISTLPNLSTDSIPIDDSCPICLVSFRCLVDCGTSTAPTSILRPEIAESEKLETFGDVANEWAAEEEDLENARGVTRLDGCGHVFCRKDLIVWISSFHGTCPTCRHTFLDIRPPSDSDDESSDGGEYIPHTNPSSDFEDEDDLDLDLELEAEVDYEGTDQEDAWSGGVGGSDDSAWGFEDGEHDTGELDLDLEGAEGMVLDEGEVREVENFECGEYMWDESMEGYEDVNWDDGLTDGDTMSEGELASGGSELGGMDDDAAIRDADTSGEAAETVEEPK